MHWGNNWGYHEGERKGVNAQGETTGVIMKEREGVNALGKQLGLS